ncbi:MAG TPA: glucosaminidase domain-containing protein [Bacteroidia bacterium]|nr:glucosaminidase domain-containing protein [Bacteroidia bacterium]
MERKYYLLFIFLLTAAFSLKANPRLTREEYISLYKDDAVRDMLKTGVPASITLAQAVFESGDGNSELAREANNHFGIKCHKEWAGETFSQDDDHRNECFRRYNSVRESFDDHSDFLRTRDRYAFLFSLPRTDYKAWAHGLKKAGYATNPDYPTHLIKIIEENQLYVLDTITSPETASSENVIVVAANPKPKPISEGEITEVSISASRMILELNRTQYVVARKGDNYQSLAKEFDMMPWQILKYNDLSRTDAIHVGEIIFLKPKRSKGEKEFHIVQDGESLRDISQQYAVKLNALHKINQLQEGMSLATGQKIWLSKKKPA